MFYSLPSVFPRRLISEPLLLCRTLLQQLQSLQAMVTGKLPKSCRVAGTQTSSCLMVRLETSAVVGLIPNPDRALPPPCRWWCCVLLCFWGVFVRAVCLRVQASPQQEPPPNRWRPKTPLPPQVSLFLLLFRIPNVTFLFENVC